MWVLHLCVQCTWSSVLAVDDAAYSRFSSIRAVYSVLEKTFWVSWKVLNFFLSKRVGTLNYT